MLRKTGLFYYPERFVYFSLWRNVMTTISIRLASGAELPAIADLVMAQEARQRAYGTPYLAMHARHQIEAALTSLWQEDRYGQPLVALDSNGKVRAFAYPDTWELPETSVLLAFLSARNGIVRHLTLPDPIDADASSVAASLLNVLDDCWRSANTASDLIRWPGADKWVEPLLLRQGFQLDSICAVRSLTPFFAAQPVASSLLHIRPALSIDENALINLFEEELCFHERYTPFVHCSSQVLQAFRQKLQRLWQGASLSEGAPMVLVAELSGEIIAMVENTLLVVGAFDEPGFTAQGCYWCIDNISVREAFRGQGVGRQLLQEVENRLAELQLELNGYVLWFNPDNPEAAAFWSRLGFQPLWTTYQRRYKRDWL
jgi:GNAT superfamily N-acetyltransferase